jgi:hypothetical protein
VGAHLHRTVEPLLEHECLHSWVDLLELGVCTVDGALLAALLAHLHANPAEGSLALGAFLGVRQHLEADAAREVVGLLIHLIIIFVLCQLVLADYSSGGELVGAFFVVEVFAVFVEIQFGLHLLDFY